MSFVLFLRRIHTKALVCMSNMILKTTHPIVIQQMRDTTNVTSRPLLNVYHCHMSFSTAFVRNMQYDNTIDICNTMYVTRSCCYHWRQATLQMNVNIVCTCIQLCMMLIYMYFCQINQHLIINLCNVVILLYFKRIRHIISSLWW